MVTIYNWVSDPTTPVDDLARVLEYLWESELRSYESDPGPNHIFRSLAAVANWLNSGTDWTPDEYVSAWNGGNRDGWTVSGKYQLKRHERNAAGDVPD